MLMFYLPFIIFEASLAMRSSNVPPPKAEGVK